MHRRKNFGTASAQRRLPWKGRFEKSGGPFAFHHSGGLSQPQRHILPNEAPIYVSRARNRRVPPETSFGSMMTDEIFIIGNLCLLAGFLVMCGMVAYAMYS